MKTLRTKYLYTTITLAMKDLQRAEKSPDYVIDMLNWHNPKSDGCHVCLAGAVMAFEFYRDPMHSHKLRDFWEVEPARTRTWKKLLSLDSARDGHFITAYDHFYGKPPSDRQTKTLRALSDRKVVPYEWDSAKFKSDMAHAIKVLREAKI